ncbi:phosphoglycolate phosphatase [Sulfolobus acidocaldarius SUSAZ]|nr:phosphoglycolate phosphatase [Sulfolobus acidocaldarius SUSAZ]
MNKDIIFVSDYDRTLSSEKNSFRIDKEVARIVNDFSKTYPFFVVTGREKKFIDILAPELKPTGWILENGALMYVNGELIYNIQPSWFDTRKNIIKILDNSNISYSLGNVIVYVDKAHEYKSVLDSIKDATVEWNRNDAMILPKGVDKGSAIIQLRERLGYRGKIVAIGDSENDISMFRVADIRVSVANALPMIKEISELILEKEDGEGVKEFLLKILKGEIILIK